MTQSSRPRSFRRSLRRSTETRQQLIAFALRGEMFAVPIGLVHKVVAVNIPSGSLEDGGPRLVPYVERQIAAIRLSQWLFPLALPATEVPSQSSSSDSHMLVVQSPNHELVGLLIANQPSLIRVSTSAFAPIPATFLQRGQIRYVGAMVNRGEQSPIFLISIGELMGELYPQFQAELPSQDPPRQPHALGASSTGYPKLLPERPI
ncbi:MAG: chemotaxis protein CheW [Cyanobacteria bacterium P01_A01_bin.135]